MQAPPFLIVNPAAQAGRVGRLWQQEVKPALDAAGFPYEFELTKAPGQAIALAAQKAAAGPRVVCAVGGDGTANEVLNGVLKGGGGSSFGAIPIGSGNDIPATFGVPEKDVPAAIRCLTGGQDLAFDVGWARNADRYFGGAASMGFDADVTDRANKSTGARKSYNLTVLKTLMAFRPYDLRITVDGKDLGVEPRMLVAIGNGKRYGGGMHICPAAEIDDGRFSVSALRKLGRLGLLRVFPKVFDGRHVGHPQVDVFDGERIEVECADRPCLYQVDGEVLGHLPEVFEAKRSLLRVRVPVPYVSYADQWKARRAR